MNIHPDIIKILLLTYILFNQTPTVYCQNIGGKSSVATNISYLNPGFHSELVSESKSTLWINFSYGLQYSYPKLSNRRSSGIIVFIAPSIELGTKYYYNRNKRIEQGKLTLSNSGPYLGARVMYRGPETYANFTRVGSHDLMSGPVWGIRSIGKFKMNFSIGPGIYTNLKGRVGFAPAFIEFALFF